jgi:hypothetical protein
VSKAKLAIIVTVILAFVMVTFTFQASLLPWIGKQSATEYVTEKLIKEVYEIEASFPESVEFGSKFELEFHVGTKEDSITLLEKELFVLGSTLSS